MPLWEAAGWEEAESLLDGRVGAAGRSGPLAPPRVAVGSAASAAGAAAAAGRGLPGQGEEQTPGGKGVSAQGRGGAQGLLSPPPLHTHSDGDGGGVGLGPVLGSPVVRRGAAAGQLPADAQHQRQGVEAAAVSAAQGVDSVERSRTRGAEQWQEAGGAAAAAAAGGAASEARPIAVSPRARAMALTTALQEGRSSEQGRNPVGGSGVAGGTGLAGTGVVGAGLISAGVVAAGVGLPGGSLSPRGSMQLHGRLHALAQLRMSGDGGFGSTASMGGTGNNSSMAQIDSMSLNLYLLKNESGLGRGESGLGRGESGTLRGESGTVWGDRDLMRGESMRFSGASGAPASGGSPRPPSVPDWRLGGVLPGGQVVAGPANAGGRVSDKDRSSWDEVEVPE